VEDPERSAAGRCSLTNDASCVCSISSRESFEVRCTTWRPRYVRRSIPILIRNGFDQSTALNRHIARRLESALRAHQRYVQRVDVRLSDANGPKKGPADKVALIEIALRPFGEIVARGEAKDVYTSVTTAAARVKEALSRYAGRLERGERRPRPT
jgi:ribosome-associated translation inhibitor RaiA